MAVLSKEEFLNWAKEYDSERGLSEKDYGLLYEYLEVYGYSVGVDVENCIYRVDMEEDGIIFYSIDELIKEVSGWNARLLEVYNISLKVVDMSSEEKLCVNQVIEKLNIQYKDLDRMYMTTELGKMLRKALKSIVEEGVLL